MLDLWREIRQTISNNKLRTALTGLAVAWGIFMLIVLLGVTQGVTNVFAKNNDLENERSLMVFGGVTSMPYKGMKEGRTVRLHSTDMAVLEQDLPDLVRGAKAYTYLDSARLSTPRDYLAQGLYGVFPEQLRDQSITMQEGRFINQADIDLKRKVVVISERAAQLLFGTTRGVVGRRASACGLSWLVVGVYSSPNSDTSPFAPFTTVMALGTDQGYVHRIMVYASRIGNEAEAQAFEESVRGTLGEKHKFNPDDRSAVYVWNRFEIYLANQKAFGILHIAMWVLGILTLLTGIVGVSNIMFVSVKERTHEIGIRRAIGAKPRSIMGQVVAESVAITTLFGYIGIVLGIFVLWIIDKFFGNTDFMYNPSIGMDICIEVTIVLIISGMLAGMFPAWKATKVRPVEALRDE